MTIRLNFVGDIGLFKSYERKYIDPIAKVQIPIADYNIGNFEFIGHGSTLKKAYFDVQTKYFPSLKFLEKCNLEKFQYLSLANNHIMDFGADGVKKNIKLLESKNIKYFGFGCNNDFNTAEIHKNNIKILLIGCIGTGRWSKSNNNGCGPDELIIEKLKKFIFENKQKYNHIIVFPHWGSELVDIPDRGDIQKAHQLINSGATAVIGTHSHIVQGIEEYKNGVIAYGLGIGI